MDWLKKLKISDKVAAIGEESERRLLDRFYEIDRLFEANQLKVLAAFQENRVSAECMNGTTGYGYNDTGRDRLEDVYATAFGAEAALVRGQIACGTHALAVALAANTRPGDEILSPVGRPYDTLEEVIGIRPSLGSLAEYNISYREVDLKEDGSFDFEGIKNAIGERTRLVTIQRSRGYAQRPTLSVESIGKLISFIRSVRPEVICMVDNCYGEFTQYDEPLSVGADMIVGSLIKNPGGGLAPSGGYIAGKRECIERCAVRLTSPGLGAEVGASLNMLKDLYQGFFMAPSVTASALKGAVFAAEVFGSLGFKVNPTADEDRYDIIQSIELGDKERLMAFCEGIQAAAPVDSYLKPVPWDMPGYDDPVIMAAGAFISGSSIELSCDGPMREPYAAYFQGGLTYPHVKFGILLALQKLYDASLV